MVQETTDLVHAFYEDDEYRRQLPGKKDYVSIQKGVHKQKWLVLCNLHELFVAFKERNPDVKIGFSNFCTLHPKWCVIAGSSGTHSVCVCTTHQNIILLVDALNCEVTYKDLVNKVVYDPSNRECMMHRCTNCPGRNALLEEELSDIDPNFQFHYSQRQTTDRASPVTITSTCEEYKDTLISAINTITKRSFLAKCQANFLRAKKESLKANEVIVLGDFAEITLLMVMEMFNTILFVSSLMITTTMHILFIKYKQSLLITLKKTFQLWIRSSISLAAVLSNIRIAKTLLICVIISKISVGC